VDRFPSDYSTRRIVGSCRQGGPCLYPPWCQPHIMQAERQGLHASLTIVRRALERRSVLGQHIFDQIRAYYRTSESYRCGPSYRHTAICALHNRKMEERPRLSKDCVSRPSYRSEISAGWRLYLFTSLAPFLVIPCQR
jgi:hypothetical protein